jgi:hypothetical protein
LRGRGGEKREKFFAERERERERENPGSDQWLNLEGNGGV